VNADLVQGIIGGWLLASFIMGSVIASAITDDFREYFWVLGGTVAVFAFVVLCGILLMGGFA
jgi:hypothetical protein